MRFLSQTRAPESTVIDTVIDILDAERLQPLRDFACEEHGGLATLFPNPEPQGKALAMPELDCRDAMCGRPERGFRAKPD